MKPAYLLLFLAFEALTINQVHSMDESGDSPSKRPTGRFWEGSSSSSDKDSPARSSDGPLNSPMGSPRTPDSGCPGSPVATISTLQLSETPPGERLAGIQKILNNPNPLSPETSTSLAKKIGKLPKIISPQRRDLTALLRDKISKTPTIELTDPTPETDWYYNLFEACAHQGICPPAVPQLTHITTGDHLGGGHLIATLNLTHNINPRFTNPDTGVSCAQITPKSGLTGPTKNSTLFPEQFSVADIERLIQDIHNTPNTIIAKQRTAAEREKFLARDPQTGLVITGYVDNGFNYRTLFPALFYGAEEDSSFLQKLADLFTTTIEKVRESIATAKENPPEFRLQDGTKAVVNIGQALHPQCDGVYIEINAPREEQKFPQVKRMSSHAFKF